MKLVLVFVLLVFSSFASAFDVPCSTDSVKVVKAIYNPETDSTLVTLNLYERNGDIPGDIFFLKTITHSLEGEVLKEEIKTNLQIKINVFRRIRVCQLDITREE